MYVPFFVLFDTATVYPRICHSQPKHFRYFFILFFLCVCCACMLTKSDSSELASKLVEPFMSRASGPSV